MGYIRTIFRLARSKIKRKDPAAFVLQINPNILELLDRCSAEDIENTNNIFSDFLKYQWDYFSELEFQRSQLSGQLHEALSQSGEIETVFDLRQENALTDFSEIIKTI